MTCAGTFTRHRPAGQPRTEWTVMVLRDPVRQLQPYWITRTVELFPDPEHKTVLVPYIRHLGQWWRVFQTGPKKYIDLEGKP